MTIDFKDKKCERCGRQASTCVHDIIAFGRTPQIHWYCCVCDPEGKHQMKLQIVQQFASFIGV